MLVGVAGGYEAAADKLWPYNGRKKPKAQFWPINTSKPLILQGKKKRKKKKEDFGQLKHFLGIFISLFSIFLFQKHLQTHQNTFDSSLFTKITRQCSCTQSFSPWFHTLDLRFRGVDVAFQLQSTPLSLQSFIKFFSSFSYLNNMFYFFPSMSISILP